MGAFDDLQRTGVLAQANVNRRKLDAVRQVSVPLPQDQLQT
jgi:hypothetical protein